MARDARTAFTYLNNRYYDPALGVFLSVDPLVSKTGDPYLYANGNPTTLSDPAGLCAARADHVVETARRRAEAHGRLSTPLLLALDEAANVAPIPKLDRPMSTGDGSGIYTMLVVQSVDQARNT